MMKGYCTTAAFVRQYIQGGDDMELLLDIIFEIYVELMMYIVPEEKAASKNTEELQFLRLR